MPNRDPLQRRPQTETPAPGPRHAIAPGTGERDHFLRLMFFQASHPLVSGTPGHPQREPGVYGPLRLWKARDETGYDLPLPAAAAPAQLESPALEVMTDLRHIPAVTIGQFGTVDAANRLMIERGVRALFVVHEGRRLLGILTARDILGERPVQITHERGIAHREVLVRDVMTPADRLEVIDLEELRYARVGDVIATLRHSGRQHALAVEIIGAPDASAQQTVCGIFSLTQIARQLGIPVQQPHDIGRTFAEIEAAIGA